jgi:hypothetical protein
MQPSIDAYTGKRSYIPQGGSVWVFALQPASGR